MNNLSYSVLTADPLAKTSLMMSSKELDGELIQQANALVDTLGIKVSQKNKDDYSFLKSDTFYIEVFKVIQAQSAHPLDQVKFDRETRGQTPGERIQSLINKLGQEVLMMDISHIKGEKIAQGDIKHLSDMLQLLEALWYNQNQNPSDGEEEMFDHRMDSDLNENESFNQEKELNDANRKLQLSKNAQNNQKDELFEQMVQDAGLAQTVKPAPGIPVYSEDPVNYKDMVLEPKYGRGNKY